MLRADKTNYIYIKQLIDILKMKLFVGYKADVLKGTAMCNMLICNISVSC